MPVSVLPVNIPPAISCTSSVVSPVSVPHETSVPSDFNTCPLVPGANTAGFPEASPYIILPRATPANLARVTASSAIFAVVTLTSVILAVVI